MSGQEKHNTLKDFVLHRANEIALKEWKREIISDNQIKFDIKQNGDILLTKRNRDKEPITYEDVSRYLEELVYVSSMLNKTYDIPETFPL